MDPWSSGETIASHSFLPFRIEEDHTSFKPLLILSVSSSESTRILHGPLHWRSHSEHKQISHNKTALLHHPAGFSQKTNNIPLMTTKYSSTVFVPMTATDQQHCRVLIRVLRVRAGLRTNGKTGSGKNVSTNSLYNSLPLIFPFPPVG